MSRKHGLKNGLEVTALKIAVAVCGILKRRDRAADRGLHRGVHYRGIDMFVWIHVLGVDVATRQHRNGFGHLFLAGFCVICRSEAPDPLAVDAEVRTAAVT